MSKHNDDFYCLNSFHLFKTKNKLECSKRLFEKKNTFVALQCLLKIVGYYGLINTEHLIRQHLLLMQILNH